MTLLELRDVSYTYEGTSKVILDNNSMSFEAGKLYVIKGKSGAGKSTLLSLISGLDLPTQGDLLYLDQSLKDLDRDRYRSNDVGVIFQGYNLLTSSTALENVLLSLNINGSIHRNSKDYALNLLDQVGIDEISAKRKVLKLSGGEQQRVGIARALSYEPKIIIADEPTGNLDEENAKQIMDILKDLAVSDNRCVIVVSHSQSVTAYADELWGLNKGKLVFIK